MINETEYGLGIYEGWHSHQNNHLAFVLNGGSREEHKSGFEFEELPGQLTFYRNNDLHRSINTKPQTKIINVEIENSFINQYEIDIRTLNPQTLNTPNAKFSFLKLYKEAGNLDNSSVAGIHLLLLNILSCTDQKNVVKPIWLLKLIELLNDCWCENLSLIEISKIINVHPVTISKYFPRYFRLTLGEYIRNIRLEKAIVLVKTTNLSLTEITHKCAFYDQSHFIRHFKNATGFLPNELRKR
ncbi:HTH-type transcriptional activator RhaS [compost metagenome]